MSLAGVLATVRLVPQARAEEDDVWAQPRADAAPAYHFPPPPELAAPAPAAATAEPVTVAAVPLPPRQPDTFEEPPAPTLAPAAGEEALARAAIRSAKALATPGWTAAPEARAGRWAKRVGDDLEAELRCLALNVYWEARSEPALGRFAVATVTLNRVASRAFPDTICGVVRQGEELGRYRCQFTWVCDRRDNEPDDDAAWRDAEHVAFAALFLNLPDPTRGALWYHADYVSPAWAGSMAQAMRIGRHLFYRGPVRAAAATVPGAAG